ncbi:hypothetical protein GCM10007977_088900 [Dactylosporangium sucinum]|uniref:Uncharacterized protein n=1 Tax=Dactylosporangium sucinum TaxID=1424081 RepID=A0A917UB50_9ACTN|nr:hypothetical protein GCM10007977_088900 [Dactylosporangium sucinum]
MEPDDDHDAAVPSGGNSLMIIGMLGILVIVGFLYSAMTG